jgi:hypothetical protein
MQSDLLNLHFLEGKFAQFFCTTFWDIFHVNQFVFIASDQKSRSKTVKNGSGTVEIAAPAVLL